MGFLGSTFMKGYALRMKLQAERRLNDVTMEVSRCKRQMSNLQRNLRNQKKYQDTMLSGNYQSKMQALYAGLEKDASGNLTETGQKQYQNMQSSIFLQQQQYQTQKAYAEQAYEDYYTAQLEPLKDLEDRLVTEKSEAEQDRTFWDETYKAYSGMAKEDLKTVIPEANG